MSRKFRARAVKNGIVVAERLAAMELPNKIAAQMAGIKSERDDSMGRAAGILGLGSALPEQILTN